MVEKEWRYLTGTQASIVTEPQQFARGRHPGKVEVFRGRPFLAESASAKSELKPLRYPSRRKAHEGEHAEAFKCVSNWHEQLAIIVEPPNPLEIEPWVGISIHIFVSGLISDAWIALGARFGEKRQVYVMEVLFDHVGTREKGAEFNMIPVQSKFVLCEPK
jgi:hypothetical protein